jgi:hypothetical protein
MPGCTKEYLRRPPHAKPNAVADKRRFTQPSHLVRQGLVPRKSHGAPTRIHAFANPEADDSEIVPAQPLEQRRLRHGHRHVHNPDERGN